MTNERTCPHCGGAVAEDRNICPHCYRTLPVTAAGPRPEPPAPPPATPAPEALRRPYEPPYYMPPPAHEPQHEPPPHTPAPPRHDDTLAIVGLIMGVLGIACCGCLSMLCPVGLIMSIVAHNRRPTGLSLAGIIIGAFGSVLFVVSVAWSIYVTMNPEVYAEMMRRLFEQMGIPMPPGFPMP